MAHGITSLDSCQLARVPAWHKLGTVFPTAPSWEDGVTRPLGWTVKKVPLVAVHDEQQVMVPDNFGIVREDTLTVLGVVGNNYKPIQNTEAFAVVEQLVASGECEIESSGSLFGGQKVWLLLRVLDASDVEVMAGDVVKPYLLVTTSHDGSSSLRCGFTAVRVVCNNTLTASLSGAGFSSIRHTANADKALEILRHSIDVGKRELASTAEIYKRLTQQRVDLKKAEELIKEYRSGGKEETEISKREQNLREELLHIYSMQRGDTMWHFYNAINEYNCHERGRSDATRLDKQWFSDGDEDRELLQFCHQASLKMAA